MSIEVGEERFRVDARREPDGREILDFTWLNGPDGGTYGFTVARGPVPETEAGPTRAQLERRAAGFVRVFFSEGGIGPSDFPDFVAARASGR